MNMLVEIILELLELPVCDREGIAGVDRDCLFLRKVTDRMDCFTDLFVLAMESEK